MWNLRLFSLLVIVTGLLTTPPANATLEDIAASATDGQRNLLRLVVALRRLQQADALPQELADVVADLDATDPASVTAIRTLRSLLPDVNRLQIVRDRAAVARASLGLHDHQRAAQWGRFGARESATGADRDRLQLWVERLEDDAEQRARDGFDGFDADTAGTSIGLEYELTENLSANIRLGNYDATVVSDVFGRDRQDGREASLGIGYRLGDHHLSATFSAVATDTNRTRGVIVNAPSGLRFLRLQADIDATQNALSLGYAGILASGDYWQLSPYAGATYARLETDDYEERSSSGSRLQVSSETEVQVLGSAGLSMSWHAIRGGWLFAPQLSAAVEHDFRADPTVTTTRLGNAAPRFQTEGFDIEETRFRFGAGMHFMHERGFGVGLYYDGQRKGDYRYDAAIISLQMTF